MLFSREVQGLLSKCQLLTLSKRSRGKINIQKPRAPHHERAKVLKLTEPFFPSKYKNMSLAELCGNLKPTRVVDEVENPYQKLLAKECLNWFKHSRLVTLYHLNPMNADERFKAYVTFRKSNMHMKIYGLKTLRMALVDTRFEAFTENYVSQNLIVFCPDPNVKEMLKITKKFPQLVLLAGILEGQFLSKDELTSFGQFTPDLQTAQQRLVGALQSAGGQQLQQMLTQHQNSLVSMLDERMKQLK